MSLWVSLAATGKNVAREDGQEIGSLEVIRRGRDYSTDPDSHHRYLVKLGDQELGDIDDHRYGDGAWVLAVKAIQIYIVSPLIAADQGRDTDASTGT